MVCKLLVDSSKVLSKVDFYMLFKENWMPLTLTILLVLNYKFYLYSSVYFLQKRPVEKSGSPFCTQIYGADSSPVFHDALPLQLQLMQRQHGPAIVEAHAYPWCTRIYLLKEKWVFWRKLSQCRLKAILFPAPLCVHMAIRRNLHDFSFLHGLLHAPLMPWE